MKSLMAILGLSTTLSSGALSQAPRDIVHGNLVQFNENGAWCWYQDERAVVDVEKGKMVIGSVASARGPGGSPRNGDIDAVMFGLSTRTSEKHLLKNGGGNAFYCDDHNAPAFLVRPDGKYLVVFAAHFNDTTSYYRIYDGTGWGSEQRFNWNQERTGGSNFQTTYSNVYHLSAEGRTYNFVRGNNKSPNSMVSTDMGVTWSYGGQLAYGSNIGYNNGYYRYSGNGVDRIDFICTEYHPRDYNTSIYHGYINDGKSYKSDGTLVDGNIFDVESIPDASDFSLVFAAGTTLGGITINRCWNIDVQRYRDGTVATIISGRINDNTFGNDNAINPEHCFVYCRYDGSRWNYTYLGQAGPKLYSSEADYTGLAAMHPKDPNTIFISTSVDPRDGSNLSVHEIFKGATNDDGRSWEWSAMTWNSVRDNLRPIVPAWDDDHTALLWWRGTYFTAQRYDAAVVGIIENEDETVGQMTYWDANTSNTRLSSGDSLELTGPAREPGPADDRWHLRYGFGNDNKVFASGEMGGEDAPALRTELTIANEGIYDIWVNFWANPEYDWRIKAGLSEDNMQLFRQMACRHVEAGDHSPAITTSDDGNTFLYQAYVGRIDAVPDSSFRVFIDDETIQTGTINTRVGDIARTWYDGISYAKVTATNVVSVAEDPTPPLGFSLSENYPNPFNPTTTISFRLPQRSTVRLVLVDVLGKEVMNITEGDFDAGIHSVQLNASRLTSGVYFYRLKAGDSVSAKKMVLMK